MEHHKNRKTPRPIGSDGDTKSQLMEPQAVPKTVTLFIERPTPRGSVIVYSKVVGETVAGLVAGGMTLSAIADLPGMPNILTVKRWMKNQPEFLDEMKLAYEARAEILADSALQMADQTTWKTVKEANLKFEIIQWLAKAFDRDKYGDKIQTEHKGEVTFLIQNGFGDQPKPVQILKGDPKTILEERNANNRLGLQAPSDSARDQIETAEILSDSSPPPTGEIGICDPPHDRHGAEEPA